MHGQVVGRTDDDKLTRAFKQVKTPLLDLGNHGAAADLALKIAHGTPHNSTCSRGFRAEQLVKVGRIPRSKPGFAQLYLFHAENSSARMVYDALPPSLRNMLRMT